MLPGQIDPRQHSGNTTAKLEIELFTEHILSSPVEYHFIKTVVYWTAIVGKHFTLYICFLFTV